MGNYKHAKLQTHETTKMTSPQILYLQTQMCAMPLVHHLRAEADVFRPLGTYQCH